MKNSYKIPIIVISIILGLSFFVISYDNTSDDTPIDVEILFDAGEYSVSFVVTGNTDNLEMDIPLDMIDGVFMIYVNGEIVDDDRVVIDGNKVIVNYGQNIEYVKLMGSHDIGGAESEPEPGLIPESDLLQQQKQQQAKIHVQKTIMTDYRGHEYDIKAINEYRNEFEKGYFLEQFIISNKQNYEKDDLIHFVFAEWGYQQQECTSPKIEVYLRPYENYGSIEKISEWQKSEEKCHSIDSDSDGYLIVNIRHMPGIFEPHDTCTIPGEYRIVASNLKDESKKEYGYYTCQQEKLIGEPQPWMELPE